MNIIEMQYVDACRLQVNVTNVKFNSLERSGGDSSLVLKMVNQLVQCPLSEPRTGPALSQQLSLPLEAAHMSPLACPITPHANSSR